MSDSRKLQSTVSTPETCLASSTAMVAQIVRRRRTTKVLASENERARYACCWTAAHRQALRSIIATAGYAPFHRRAHEQTHCQTAQNSPVPWRFHVIEGQAVDLLLDHLQAQAVNSPDSFWSAAWKSKIKNMLTACGALVLVTWLPDPTPQDTPPALTLNNTEHIAATGAAVQNLLLLAEAEGWRSYWSSGGILRESAVFDYLGIAREQVLLGAVFLSPQEMPAARELAGALHDQRGTVDNWSRWVAADTLPPVDAG